MKYIFNEKEMTTIDGIPVYEALITDAETGMMKISLVDEPAVMSNFLAFDRNVKKMMYEVQDEDKRLVRGVVMRADFPIYRYSPQIGEYYVIYKPEQIRIMAEKYLAEGRCNFVNLMHDEDKEVDCVKMVQYFIKGDGVKVDGFEDISEGSLFAEFHVLDNALWSEIKAGTYKGFSLEGFFEMAPEEDAERVAEIVDDLDGKFSSLNIKNKNLMSKISKIKAGLAKLLQEFGNVTTDKGVLAWDGDEDLKAGDAVYIEDADGNRTPAEDGEYKTEDNKTIVVADGVVSEIKDPEAEVDTNPEPEADEEMEGEGDEAPEGETPEDKDEIIKTLEAKIADLEAENAALKDELDKMKKMSLRKPAHEEVETSLEPMKTGNKGLDRLARIMSAK